MTKKKEEEEVVIIRSNCQAGLMIDGWMNMAHSVREYPSMPEALPFVDSIII